MDNMVKKKLSAFRKRQTVFVIIYGLINAAVIAGIIVYYRLKEQVEQPWKVPDTAAMVFRI